MVKILYVQQKPHYNLQCVVSEIPTLHNTHSTSWRAYRNEAQYWRMLLKCGLREHRPLKPLAFCELHMLRFSSRIPDYESLVYSFKPIVDALGQSQWHSTRKGKVWVDRCDIMQDDTLAHCDRHYYWVKSKKKDSRIALSVTEIAPVDHPGRSLPHWLDEALRT